MKNKNFAKEKLKNFFEEKYQTIPPDGRILNVIDNLPQKQGGKPFAFRKAFLASAASLILVFAVILPVLFLQQKGVNFSDGENDAVEDSSGGLFDVIENALTDSFTAESAGGSDYFFRGVTVSFAAKFSAKGGGVKNDVSDICGNNIEAVLAEISFYGFNGAYLHIKGEKGEIKLLGEKYVSGYTFDSDISINGQKPYNGSLTISVDGGYNITEGNGVFTAESGTLTILN